MSSHLTRRRFLAAAAGALGTAALGDGFLVEPTAIAVTRHDVRVRGLPPALEGTRIACVTDLHLHDGVHAAARVALERLAAARPEVVALIGDMCNDQSDLANLTAWARDARGTLATFATFGNWEHDAGIDRATLATTYDRAGVELLCNSAAEVRLGGRETGYATLTVVGLDDPVLGKPDPGAALAQVSSGGMTTWALHGPGYIDTLPRAAFPAPSFVLAGHTHGGQIRVPGWTPYTPGGSGRFVAGWYRDTFAPLYVARGIGTVFMRARLFCPPELPIFTLRPA